MLQKRKGYKTIIKLLIILFTVTAITFAIFYSRQNADFIDTIKEVKLSEALASSALEASFEKEEEEKASSNDSVIEIEQTQTLSQEKEELDFYIEEIPLSYELQEYSWQICREYEIQYELFLAVMWKESRFDPNQIYTNTNGTTDSGLMQINDINREILKRELNITDLQNPKENIRGGAYLLAPLLHKYEETRALIAYQYGESGMAYREQNGLSVPLVIQNTLSKRDEFANYRHN